MFASVIRLLRPAIGLLFMLTLILGILYPAFVTVVAQVLFPSQANGSFIKVDGRTLGSSLIGQAFEQPQYFWGRPSAAGPATTGWHPADRTWDQPARRWSTG